MGRINIFGVKAKFMGLYLDNISIIIGLTIGILVWLNMSTREGFQAAPVNTAMPVPIDSISTQKKQDLANAVIQLYHSIIIAEPSPMGIQNVPPMTDPSMPTPPMPTPPMPTPPVPPMPVMPPMPAMPPAPPPAPPMSQ
jgi:hypothetical protein